MTNGIDATNDASDARVQHAETTAKPCGQRAAPFFAAASGNNNARHRGAQYDWMDFHSISELSQEW